MRIQINVIAIMSGWHCIAIASVSGIVFLQQSRRIDLKFGHTNYLWYDKRNAFSPISTHLQKIFKINVTMQAKGVCISILQWQRANRRFIAPCHVRPGRVFYFLETIRFRLRRAPLIIAQCSEDRNRFFFVKSPSVYSDSQFRIWLYRKSIDIPPDADLNPPCNSHCVIVKTLRPKNFEITSLFITNMTPEMRRNVIDIGHTNFRWKTRQMAYFVKIHFIIQ